MMIKVPFSGELGSEGSVLLVAYIEVLLALLAPTLCVARNTSMWHHSYR